MNPTKNNHSLAKRHSERQLRVGPFENLQNEMNSLFDQFLTLDRSPYSRAEQRNWPSVEVKEDEEQYRVIAEIPGVEEEDIQLSVENNMLEISGERRQELVEERAGRSFSEMSYGRFYRAIPFEHHIDEEKITAQMKDGLLKIVIPKDASERRQTRKIEITH